VTRFLIDSGAFLAMLDVSDRHHATADAFLNATTSAMFYVVDTVFAETMVLIKARLGAQAAVDLGSSLMRSRQFLLVISTAQDRLTTWEVFNRYTDKDWSYMDCSILALARGLGVTGVFAFDHHFDQMTDLARLPALNAGRR